MQSNQRPLLTKLCANLQFYLFEYLHFKDLFRSLKLSRQNKDIILKSIIKQAKHSKAMAYFYLEYYIILNRECYIYYKNKIKDSMNDADGLYSLFTSPNLKLFYEYIGGVFWKEKDSFEEFKEKKGRELSATLYYNITNFLVQRINKTFNDENIVYLDFNSLLFPIDNKLNFELFISFIKKNTSLQELDLSKSVFNENDLLTLLDAIEKKESFYTLDLTDVDVSQKIIIVITQIEKKDPKKRIVRNKKYTGKSKSMLNFSQVKHKKFKFKKIKPGNIIYTDSDSDHNEH